MRPQKRCNTTAASDKMDARLRKSKLTIMPEIFEQVSFSFDFGCSNYTKIELVRKFPRIQYMLLYVYIKVGPWIGLVPIHPSMDP